MFGLTTTRRARAELDAAKSEIQRQRRRAETAEENLEIAVFNRAQVLRQNQDLDAATRRLHGRVEELKRQLDARPATGMDDTARLEQRIVRLRKVVSRVLEGRAAATRRADYLQQCYDNAVGLGGVRVRDSSIWQPGYQPPRPKAGAS